MLQEKSYRDKYCKEDGIKNVNLKDKSELNLKIKNKNNNDSQMLEEVNEVHNTNIKSKFY